MLDDQFSFEEVREEFENTIDSYKNLVKFENLEHEDDEGDYINLFYEIGDQLYAENANQFFSVEDVLGYIFQIRGRMHKYGFNQPSPHSISGSMNGTISINSANNETEKSNSKVVNLKRRKLNFEKTIRFCSYLFPRECREIAIGDITETRQEMISDGCSKIIVNLFSSFKIVCFILSTLRIRWSDFVDSEKERNR